jgi:putative intracellular protease/amidase
VFGESGYHVITVAADAGPVRTVFGQNVLPDYTFANAPRADILVIPGGDVDEALCRDPALRHWVQGEAAGARQVLSVCTGAFIAASAGLLDGLTATTYHGALAGLARAAPLTHVVSDRRFVDNGKIITTAGLSSGIDGALHLVAKLNGLGVAQGTALNMEYNWDPASPYARAALADRVLAFPMDDFSLTYLSRTGDRTHWENRWLVSEEGSLAALSARIEHALAERGQWRKQADGSWAFRDASGAPWVGRSSLEAVRGQTGRFTWTLAIQRV